MILQSPIKSFRKWMPFMDFSSVWKWGSIFLWIIRNTFISIIKNDTIQVTEVPDFQSLRKNGSVFIKFFLFRISNSSIFTRIFAYQKLYYGTKRRTILLKTLQHKLKAIQIPKLTNLNWNWNTGVGSIHYLPDSSSGFTEIPLLPRYS